MEEHKLFLCSDCKLFETERCAFPNQSSPGCGACQYLQLKDEICIREQEEEYQIERYEEPKKEQPPWVNRTCGECAWMTPSISSLCRRNTWGYSYNAHEWEIGLTDPTWRACPAFIPLGEKPHEES